MNPEKAAANGAATNQRRRRPRRPRRRDSEIARQLGITPAQLRRARYLVNTGRGDQLEAEGLAHLSQRKP